MGTTRTSGWALFWFLLGFTILTTGAVGAGVLGVLAGAAMMVMSAVMFKSVRSREEQ
ncbi:MAG: hypothetical protein HYZ73_06050 [Elusimicrobia bacterium]|nr:hypothetical protein [Elusimicrobiota bacterium]